ncbi:DUF2062 domain-containing protein [Puniceicoccales bacterium CK1056]|uniref:DUF2062 domain-containing protein n=1 Tax=Oceanipulchritudo coccoides TaxID=2706888 RepID=A0A6B2LZ50_9BACT|nr:DUF2062 domain-containing protein [Oceanipulchritudo coccoides]NDV61214.1 DUF2062 domain-containing protein [Oceanipulchritudo coccoides]
MTQEEHRLNRRRLERIARVKRVLRWMPRRANVHRYPVLRWFASATRKRSYLWCFRVKNAIPALYAGCILALLPLYGIQLPIAVGLAFLLRANLPILTSTIFITNPFTILPAYFACFQIGRVLLNIFGVDTPQINMAEMKLLIDALQSGNWAMNLLYLANIWWVTALGGIILGTSLATIAAGIYKLAAYEVMVSVKRLKELQKKRQEQVAQPPEQSPNPKQAETP